MEKISINASTAYDVLVGRGILPDCGGIIAGITGACRALIVSDSNVAPLYGDTVRDSLQRAGLKPEIFVFPAGEEHKTLATYGEILRALSEARFTRRDILVALGGGVAGDITGFAAATYMRGVKFVQVPTTFLAAVDASVGGKTAVDLPAGKNLAGAFWQPSAVICDCDTFNTLPDTVFADGAAESIKHGLIADRDFFELMESGDIRRNIERVVTRNVEIKRDFVMADERDMGLRQLLNFGHTVGHAIEKCSGYALSHGSAVAAGMVAELRGAKALGFGGDVDTDRVIRALEKHGLPTAAGYPAGDIYAAAVSDKKSMGAKIAVGYLREIGRGALYDLPIERLEEYIGAGLKST